jgi:hypothetical protein
MVVLYISKYTILRIRIRISSLSLSHEFVSCVSPHLNPLLLHAPRSPLLPAPEGYPNLILSREYDRSQLANLRLHPTLHPRLPPHRATFNYLPRSLLPCRRLPFLALYRRLRYNRGSFLLARVLSAKFPPATSTFSSRLLDTLTPTTILGCKAPTTHVSCRT